MRKAQGLARGRNRRKQQGGDGPAQQQQQQAQGPGGGGGGPANQQQHPNTNGGGPDGALGNGPMQRRKPSPEEQALTAKNYRLAKELVSLGGWYWVARGLGLCWAWCRPRGGNKSGRVLIAGVEAAGWTRSIYLAAILTVSTDGIRSGLAFTKFPSFLGFDG